MLGARHHGVIGPQGFSLETAHARRRHVAAEPYVFAGTLDSAAPAGVAGHVDHRREGPVDAGGGRLDRRDPCRLLDQFRLEACRLGERYREDGAKAVDDVCREQQRDLQAGFANRHALHLARHFGTIAVEDAAQPPGPGLGELGIEGAVGRRGIERVGRAAGPGRSHQRQLPGLLLDRHLSDQSLDGGGEPLALGRDRPQQCMRGTRAPSGQRSRSHHHRTPGNAQVVHQKSSRKIAFHCGCGPACFAFLPTASN